MAPSLPIGDFSRATHMSIKTLRHYHRVGLLEPADVDQFTGHRRYTTEQIDRAYGALATHVTQHALAVDGPIREYYLSSRHDTPDESAWRTEIGWPIFQTTGE
jgi:hypothetical protein